MAARLLLEVGPVTGERVFADTQKAADTLLAFYNKMALGPAEATNNEKLQAVADYLVRHIVHQTRDMHVFESRAAASAEAVTLYGVD